MSTTETQGMACSNTIEGKLRITGRVKWFNNKAGYGFITISDGDKKGNDIFVHHTGVIVDNEQYKYLVQGEYVSFDLKKMDTGDHEFHAHNVRGVCNGILMCETRNESRILRGPSDDGEWKSNGKRPTSTRKPRNNNNNNNNNNTTDINP